MRYKVPKDLEKVPIIAGFELKSVVLIAVATLICLFTLTINFLLSLVCPAIVGIYVYLRRKYRKDGELLNLLKYTFTPKVIIFDKTIDQLLNKRKDH